jgi:FkbM family methyltransferase
MKMRINNLLANNPLWLVDIGASGGIDPRWKNFTAALKAILFEPDPREYERLKYHRREDRIILNCALSDSIKEIDFYLCKKQETSSAYLPNHELLAKFPDAERYDVIKTVKIETDTLDNQLKKNGITEIDFIKIDTQGQELPILQGSLKSLNNVIGLEVEVEFIHLYKDQPLFDEVDKFIVKNGFELFDIRRYYWRRKNYYSFSRQKGQLVFGDALYFKNPEQVLLMKDITQEKIVRSICIYLLYGYAELAYILANCANKKGILAAETYTAIGSIISKLRDKPPIPSFRGKGRIQNFLQKLTDLFADTGWYSGTDRFLGNP